MMRNGIQIRKGEKTSYIYLSGIKPTKEIQLTSEVTLLPTKCSPDPDDMVKCIMTYGSCSEFELGILISTLRNTTAMFKVESDSEKDLVIHAWNSQTLGVLIGALLNCEVAWYFQANKPAEKFDAKTRVSMIHNNMSKFPSRIVKIDKKKCKFLEENISKAFSLNDDDRFWNATNAMWSYNLSSNQAVQISIVWSGIEALFLIEKNIKTQLSKAASRFLVGNDTLVPEIKSLYEKRCKAVHERKREGDDSLTKSVELLHNLVLKCVQLNKIPNVDDLLQKQNIEY